jgi:hypothetical protein
VYFITQVVRIAAATSQVGSQLAAIAVFDGAAMVWCVL